VRRRSMTNGNGGLQTQAPDLPLNGSGAPPQSGPLAVGPGQPGPGAGSAGDPGQVGLPVPLSQARRNGLTPSGNAAAPAKRKGSPFSISNWRVRWRLVAIIAVPTITALILGVIQIVGSVNNYESFKRVQTLANLNALVVTATGDLESERDATAGLVAMGGQTVNGKPVVPVTPAITAQLALVTRDQKATSLITDQIAADANAVIDGSGYRSQTVIALQNGVLFGITDLPNIRTAATGTLTPALSVIQNYDLRLLQPFIAFSGDVAAGTGNATLQSDVTVLNALLHVQDDASLQRAYLFQALLGTPPALTPTGLTDLNQAVAQQTADQSQFDAVASVAEQQTLNNVVSGQAVDEAESAETLAISTAGTSNLRIGTQQTCTTGSPAECWWNTKTTQITDMQKVSNQSSTVAPGLVQQIQAQANSLAQSALRSAEIVSIATLLLLLLVLLITTFVARSMIRPLRKLRADALEVAGSKLPEMVRRLSQSEGGDASAEVEPIGVNSTDEIGEVARAFDQVHREAVRLAADEAMLRGNLNAMFVNLSRRSQSLIERQLSLIDNLEQTEQDADRLSSLFRLDHLATRMRRNSENLLVLAGHEAASRRWSQPVPLVDVLRAAISEIEQYERVVLNVQPGIQVTGQAVNDVVHLVAEIVENATTFSPEDTQVYVTGQPLTSGGVLLDITDNGVGISEQEMAHANWRLDNPPVVDVAVSRRMGLFVVGRLAARHGVRVRLRHAQSGGLTALIWLPESVAAPESAQPLGRLRKFEADDFGPAPSLSAPTAVGGASPFAGVGGPGGPVGPGVAGPNAPGAPGGLGSAAATAARIPRLGGGGNGAGGNGNGGNGGFSAFGVGGNGNGGSNGNGRPASNGGNGNGSTIEVPGGSLPVRTPGSNPLGPAGGNGNGGGSLFGAGGSGTADGFGAEEIGSTDFGTTRLPALGGDGGSASSGPVPSAAPGVGNGIGGSDGSKVTIPPAVGATQDHRLPIFDSLESDWFRRSGNASLSSSSSSSSSAAAAPAAVAAGQTWSSPADEGYRAARVAAEPASDETTTAGLPKRTPRANLVPGSVGGGSGGEETESAPPARSADTIRNRMASFQRGVRDARATASQNEEP
jgi:signal transduction histidine kinase